MKKALMIAPMASLHRRFNGVNIDILKELGYEVHLAANFCVREGSEAANGEYEKYCRESGIVTHHIDFYRAASLKNFKVIKLLKTLISDGNYELIHAHSETGGLVFRAAMKKSRKYKAFYTPHGMSFYKGSSLLSKCIYRPVEKWICAGMDANIAMNREELEVLKQWDEKTANFVHGIGLDFSRLNKPTDKIAMRKSLGINDEAIVVTAVGELNENKNHKILIEALTKINNDNLYLLICGVGELRAELEKMIKQFKLEKRVKLLGFRDDICDILSASDIFAFPSYHEGLPVSVMEAMCCGLPVVCSNIRGNTDLIKSGCGGILCRPNDLDGFAEAIGRFANNERLRLQTGEYNKHAVTAYKKECVGEELRKIYE